MSRQPTLDPRDFYAILRRRQKEIKAFAKRPLTLTEKLLYSHLRAITNKETHYGQPISRGLDFVVFYPDRIDMQDATAQMALLQLISAEVKFSFIPGAIHSDHLIVAQLGNQADVEKAKIENDEIYCFLAACGERFGLDVWTAGQGIIHQIVLENYAFPGGFMIGTDSHTPNVGGVSMLGYGVGGADAVDAMAGFGVELQMPRIFRIQLSGRLTFPATPKDVILTLAGLLSTRGAIGAVLEYFGDGIDSISATGRATICNMGAELGASTSIFPYDHHTSQYLRSTGRKQVAQECDANRDLLQADPAVEKSPMEFYEKIIHLDLNSVKPCVNGPFFPDLYRPLGDLAMEARAKGWPETIEAALIGSCTNSSFEDFSKVALLARAALEVGLVCQVPLYLSPGSQTVQKLLEENGLLNDLKNLGATLLANACGPCAGQWNRNTTENNKPNSIVTSFNRNFRARNDANPNTHAFLASPESVLCFALAGNLDCSEILQKLSLSKHYRNLCDATNVLPHPHIKNMPFPEHKNTVPNEQVEIKIAPASKRLQLLNAFSPPKLDSDFSSLKLLIKVSGKCTTDHICMAGPWLRFRGHLENISDNLLIGAINSHNSEVNKVQNARTGDWMTVPKYARDLKSRGLGWIVVAEHNYGEGSSREHAALVPRHLGCKAIVCMSFARIHE